MYCAQGHLGTSHVRCAFLHIRIDGAGSGGISYSIDLTQGSAKTASMCIRVFGFGSSIFLTIALHSLGCKLPRGGGVLDAG